MWHTRSFVTPNTAFKPTVMWDWLMWPLIVFMQKFLIQYINRQKIYFPHHTITSTKPYNTWNVPHQMWVTVHQSQENEDMFMAKNTYNVRKEIHGTIISKSMENKLTAIRLHWFSRNGTVTSTCAIDLVWCDLGNDQLLHSIKRIKREAINLQNKDLLCLILRRYSSRGIRWLSMINF